MPEAVATLQATSPDAAPVAAQEAPVSTPANGAQETITAPVGRTSIRTGALTGQDVHDTISSIGAQIIEQLKTDPASVGIIDDDPNFGQTSQPQQAAQQPAQTEQPAAPQSFQPPATPEADPFAPAPVAHNQPAPRQAPAVDEVALTRGLLSEIPEIRQRAEIMAARLAPHLLEAIAAPPQVQQAPQGPTPEQIEQGLREQARNAVWARTAKQTIKVDPETGETSIVNPVLDEKWIQDHLPELDAEFDRVKLHAELQGIKSQLNQSKQSEAEAHTARLFSNLDRGVETVALAGRPLLNNGKPVGNTADYFKGPDGQPNPALVDVFRQIVHNVANSPQAVAAHNQITQSTPMHAVEQPLARWSDQVTIEALRQFRAHPYYAHNARLKGMSGSPAASPPAGTQAQPPATAAPSQQRPTAQTVANGTAPPANLLGPQGAPAPRPGPVDGPMEIRSRAQAAHRSGTTANTPDAMAKMLAGFQIVPEAI